MNEDEFAAQARQEEPLSGFLTELADDVRGGPAPKSFGLGALDPMQLAMAYAVWSLLKLGISILRTLAGLELAKCQAETVAWLVTKGYPQETAEKTVQKALDSLLKLSDDSTILQALLKLLPGKADSKKDEAKTEKTEDKTE